MKRLEYITVLRGIAILMVMAVHISQLESTINVHPYLISITSNGARGVQLFYLISAFTLFRSYGFRHDKENNPKLKFFLRRFFRIAPLFYLAICYYLWQDGLTNKYWLGDQPVITVSNIISNFLFVHGFNPYWINSIVPGGWSVAVEFVFYITFPVLFKLIKNTQNAYMFILISLGMRTVLLLFFRHHIFITDARLWNDYLYFYLPNQLCVFALGILLYFITYKVEKISISSKKLLIVAGVLFINFCINNEVLFPDIFWFGISFLLLTLSIEHFKPAILFNPFFDKLGNLSYSIYLAHFGVIYWLGRLNIFNPIPEKGNLSFLVNFSFDYLLVLVGALIIGFLLHKVIEDPFQNIGKRIIALLN